MFYFGVTLLFVQPLFWKMNMVHAILMEDLFEKRSVINDKKRLFLNGYWRKNRV